MRTALLPGALALSVLGASEVLAGAWPREEGEVFLSFGANVALFDAALSPVHYDPTIYLEYGLTPRITVGFDGFTADQSRVRSGFAFLRLPLDDGSGAQRTAISLGVGRKLVPDRSGTEDVARLGLHWGLGLDSGWLALDAEAVRRFDGSGNEAKIDATWGYRFADDWASVVMLQGGFGRAGDFYAKVSPSVLWSVNDRVSLRLGLTRALTGDEGSGLLLQAWISF